MSQAAAEAPRRTVKRRWWPPRQWPVLLVGLCMAGSLVVVVVRDFRPGTVLFAGSVLLASLLRLVLPDRQAGLLVLRTRALDVLTLLLMGLIILTLALIVPELPPGGLPATTQ